MNSAHNTYNIRITRPSPSFDQDTVVFTAASYQEAVKTAQNAWRTAKRSVTLSSGEFGLQNWHSISHKGVAVDKNFNSGVPASQDLATEGVGA